MASRRIRSPRDEADGAREEPTPERMPVLVETVTRLHTAVAWGFFAFVFSIPIEEATTSMGIPISMSKLFGYLFVGGCLIQPQICFRRPPAAFWWFFAYLCIVVVLGAMQEQRYSDEVVRLLGVSVQMAVLLWLACNLLRYEYIVKGAMISLAVSCLLVAILQRFGVGEAVEVSNYGREARFTTFGQNANEQAYILGLGLLAWIALTYGPWGSLVRPRWLVWPVFVFMVAAIVQTGSRGSTLALGAGLAVYFMQAGGGQKGGLLFLRNMAILAAALGVVLALTLLSETARLRWERTFQSGHTAGRTFLYSLAADMIEEKPLFGWGPARNRDELYARSGEISEGDFQNTALHALAEAGLIGSFPFFVGCFLWLRAAWMGRNGPLGVVPLAMTACTLIVCMTGTWVYRKQFWLVIALSLISGRLLIRAKHYRLSALENVRPRERAKSRRGSMPQNNILALVALALSLLTASGVLAQTTPPAAREARPHQRRSGPNLAPNPAVRGVTGWNLHRGAAYDEKTSHKGGSGAFDLSKPDSQVQSELIAVPPGKTYTYAAFLRTSKWPSFAYMQIAVYDAANRFKYNWQGSYQATTAADVWQETAICFTPGEGDANVRLTYGRQPAGKSPHKDGRVWVDDFYFGNGIGFDQPPAAKRPFLGAQVRVDALGNFEILRQGEWQPFFPFAVYRHARQSDFQVYSNQGFNCLFANNFNLDILQRAKNAVSKFNPHGMLSAIDIEQYLDPRQAEFRDLPGFRKNLAQLTESPLLDQVFAFYWDNEQYDQYDLPREVCQAIQKADADGQGRRRHPIFMLHGNQGVTRAFASLVDVTGDYLRDRQTQSYLGPQQSTRQRFGVLDHIEQQRIPPAIGIISEEETAQGVRRLVYEHLMAGGRGIAYFRDGALYEYNGDRASPAAKDITLRKCWAEFPKLRAEIDRLLPLIRQPHWTAWKLVCTSETLEWGTRDYKGEAHLLLLNPTNADATATFTVQKLGYAPAAVVDYFTGKEVVSVNASRFTVTLAANQTGVYRLGRPR